jgi:hypothetical protein
MIIRPLSRLYGKAHRFGEIYMKSTTKIEVLFVQEIKSILPGDQLRAMFGDTHLFEKGLLKRNEQNPKLAH